MYHVHYFLRIQVFKNIFTIICIFVIRNIITGYEQQTTFSQVHKALVDKDTVKLDNMLLDGVTYGHSHGWIQSKREVIGDMYNGKLTYKSINAESDILQVEGETGIVRTEMEVRLVMEGKALELKLKVLEVWLWENKHWKLFARQSVKI